jgi:hypothetical protein
MCKEPVFQVDRVVDKERIILKNGGPRRKERNEGLLTPHQKNCLYRTFIFRMQMLSVSAVATLLSAMSLLAVMDPSAAVPVKFMCDLCESNWMQCLMKCHMEEYMTRHNYK